MKTALFTIVPMFAAAIFVMVGGERLAQREQEERTAMDRGRLFSFSESLRTEVERLTRVYEEHLQSIAEEAAFLKADELEVLAETIVGIQRVHLFREKGKDRVLVIALDGNLPEIEMEGRKMPLNRERALVIDQDYLEEEIPLGGNWLTLNDPKYRVYCQRPSKGLLVAILVNLSEVQAVADDNLAAWMQIPLTPLREAGERVSIQGSVGDSLALTGSERHGPAAAIIPIHSELGQWQVTAWDGIVISSSYDTATLAAASVLALLLLGAGLWLFIEQRRAIRLAGERVSFVNRASHELGTPLTNVLLNLDLANESLEARPRDARTRLDLATEEVERLARLVANVLTFSRCERDTLEITPIPCIPGEIVLQTLENFRPALERRGIEIDAQVSAPAAALLDPDALSQIIGNLLSNVEKYASSGKWLGLECSVKDDQLVLTVADRGKGIAKTHRERIFTPFTRISDRTNEGSSGTGLGLSISRDLAERMGGSLVLMDSAEGMIFCLKIPAPVALALVPDPKIAL